MLSKLEIKRIIGRLAKPVSLENKARRCILLYHSVGSERGIPEKNFVEQMEFLSAHARVVRLDQLLSPGVSRGDGLVCAISFDDGYSSVHSRAWPVMRELGFTGTVFITTGAIGCTNAKLSEVMPGLYPGETMLTWQQIDELAQSGFEIGSHLRNHLNLLPLSREQVLEEMKRSRAEIEARLRRPCTSIAYPFGLFNSAIAQWASECGYDAGYSGRHGFVSPTASRYSIPRIDIRADFAVTDFQSILQGRWNYLGVIQEFRRRKRLATLFMAR